MLKKCQEIGYYRNTHIHIKNKVIYLVQHNLPDDDTLIPLLLNRDEQAFTQVVNAYHGIMKHVARAIIGDAIAEEVVQDAWIAAIKALPKFERRSSLKTWILRIVSNCAKSRLRHEARSINSDDPFRDALAQQTNSTQFSADGSWHSPPLAWHADTPDALLSSEQLKKSIDTALSELPPLQQAVITLRDIQGLDMEAICNILDISESNSRVLLHRARAYILNAIDKQQRA